MPKFAKIGEGMADLDWVGVHLYAATPSPFIIITQPERWYSFMEGGWGAKNF